MKIKGPILLSVSAILVLVAAYLPQTDSSGKESILVRTLMRGLEYMHYQPADLNDEFASKAYEIYLDNIDSGRRWLTQKDVDKLEALKTQIDDNIEEGDLAFFDLSVELLDAGVTKTKAYYKEILAKPFNFSKDELVQMDSEKREFAKNDKELKDFWRRSLKYETLTRYARALKEQEEAGEEKEIKSEEELEAEAREKVKELYDKWYDRINKLKREDRLSDFLNSLTSIFDPHTNYLKPIDKQNFDIRFSGRLEGIGARLQTDGDYTKVVDIVIGGPAWKGKELQENDIITKVAQGDEEPIDVKGMVVDDVVQYVRGKKGTEVRLTVKSLDGTEKVISIVRDIVYLEESYAKSLILDGPEDGEKIGYLYLPSFYADFENKDGRFCAPDVAKELEKLKEEKVDGIILDLRNNGGGSLRDVVRMSGFFIEEGPIVQVKSRSKKAEVLVDVDDKVQYDGPLVVMVNGFSASASEILAAALQDYGRAVVVGSNSTHGKGTVQRFVDLDRTIRGYEDYKPLGNLKLTTQKFYRINGGSTQLRGVVPDIVLPDNFHYIKTGEKQEKYPMKWSEIDPVNYNQNVMRISRDDLRTLADKSSSRVDASPTFQKVLQNAKRFKRQRDQSEYPLSLNSYQSFVENRSEEAKKYNGIFDNIINGGVKNLEVDIPAYTGNETKEARNKNFIEDVSKDAYIKETLNIIHDLIQQQ
ncbi:MAG: carboxy terminal-processing peptidase [Saprospiraceae bacterium]|nr:carboxy terminal-processing peptidase [Saprospiraceae bacterium]